MYQNKRIYDNKIINEILTIVCETDPLHYKMMQS